MKIDCRVLLLTCASLAGCQSAASGAAKTSISSAASAQWAARAWLVHEAPTRFARRAIASAHDALVQERDAVRREAKSPATSALADSIDSVARRVEALGARLDRDDRPGVDAAAADIARLVELWARASGTGS